MQRLTPEEKQLKGSLRPCREREGLDAGAKLTETPEPPECLSERAAAEWRALAPVLVSLEVLTEADLRLLQLACEALGTAAELEEAIKKDGYLLPAANGAMKGNPVIKVLESTRNQAHRLLSDFGLSPKSRKYVSKAPGARDAGRFAKWSRGQPVDWDEFEDL